MTWTETDFVRAVNYVMLKVETAVIYFFFWRGRWVKKRVFLDYVTWALYSKLYWDLINYLKRLLGLIDFIFFSASRHGMLF